MSIIHKLPFEWLVGLRYTRASKGTAHSGFLSLSR